MGSKQSVTAAWALQQLQTRRASREDVDKNEEKQEEEARRERSEDLSDDVGAKARARATICKRMDHIRYGAPAPSFFLLPLNPQSPPKQFYSHLLSPREP